MMTKVKIMTSGWRVSRRAQEELSVRKEHHEGTCWVQGMFYVLIPVPVTQVNSILRIREAVNLRLVHFIYFLCFRPK